MLTLYLTCLIVGGVFVGLSIFSGLDKDADFAADKDFDAFGDGLDADADVDLQAGADVDHVSLADASHGTDTRQPRPKKKFWLPVMSFRFWTFGSAFFGMTGAVLTYFTSSIEPLTVGISAAVGLLVGSAAAAVVRALRKPVGASRVRGKDYQGAAGELLLPLKAGGVSKVRLTVAGGVHEIVVAADGEQALPKGSQVVVMSVDAEGRARVALEEQLFALEEG